MKARLCDCLFGFVCLSIVLSDAANAVTNTNGSASASLQTTTNLTSTSSLSFAPVSPLNPNDDDKSDPKLVKKREFVVNMMREAWAGYVKCALGKEQFKPIACAGEGESTYSHVWEAMPTLWIMGLHDEFNYARKWVAQMDGSPDLTHMTRHTFLGAMLSCYALTGDKLFLDSALKFALVYFENIKQHQINQALFNWQDTQLELPYLAHLTGNQTFRKNVQVVEQIVELFADTAMHGEEGRRPKDLFFVMNGDYLFQKAKRYFQSNQTERTKIEQFNRHIEILKQTQLLNITKSGLWFFETEEHSFCRVESGQKTFFVHLCGIGAALAQNALILPRVLYNATSWRQLRADQLANVIPQWEMAKNITDTCYWASKYMSEYMIPYRNRFNQLSCYRLNANAPNVTETIVKDRFKKDDIDWSESVLFELDSFKILESYFTLWRMTGENRFRDYAWEMANKIYKYARSPNGYVNGISSEIRKTGDLRDYQPPLFYSTLSYLYLTFTQDTYLPLDKWVLNAAGHPLPICGSGNPAYSNVKC